MYNKDEYGQLIYVNMGQDVSSNTLLQMILEPKIGTKKTKTAALGTVNIDVNDETYIANQYISYTIAADDLNYAGLWRKKGKATISATNKIISDYSQFTVLE